MKNKIYLVLYLVIALINISCEEDFNPKSELKNDYIFNCVIVIYNKPESIPSPIEVNPLTLKAIISRTYNIDGFIPKKPDSSLFVPRGTVILFQGIKDFAMSDSVVVRKKDSTIVAIRNSYYSLKGAGPTLIGNDKLKILARMPDGKVLSAETITPRMARVELFPEFNHGITSKVDRFKWGNTLTFSWGDPVPNGHLLFPRFIINYTRISENKSYNAEIPTKYVNRNNKEVPLYAGAIDIPVVSFEFSSIDSAMKNIAQGSNPSDIQINSCWFILTEYDRNLSAFYSSTNGYMDSYSVRLDENIYSNVTGGLGVFGSYVVNMAIYPIDKYYVQSFGYKSTSD